jgi:hypothetical protein
VVPEPVGQEGGDHAVAEGGRAAAKVEDLDELFFRERVAVRRQRGPRAPAQVGQEGSVRRSLVRQAF